MYCCCSTHFKFSRRLSTQPFSGMVVMPSLSRCTSDWGRGRSGSLSSGIVAVNTLTIIITPHYILKALAATFIFITRNTSSFLFLCTLSTPACHLLLGVTLSWQTFLHPLLLLWSTFLKDAIIMTSKVHIIYKIYWVVT